MDAVLINHLVGGVDGRVSLALTVLHNSDDLTAQQAALGIPCINRHQRALFGGQTERGDRTGKRSQDGDLEVALWGGCSAARSRGAAAG